MSSETDEDALATQRRRMEEFAAAQRVAEEAQDEELLRLAMELSVSESSDRHLLHSGGVDTSERSGNSWRDGSGVITQSSDHSLPPPPQVRSSSQPSVSPTVTSPPLRSVLRQRLHETSTRSLEEMILGSHRGVGVPSRSISGSSRTSDRLLAPSSHSEPDSLPLDWTDDEDDDDDDEFLEDLDPDDAPELRRVRQSHQSGSIPPSTESNPRRKSSSAVPADLTAAKERFQQMSSSLSNVDRLQGRPGMRRPRPGLVVRVDAPAPKVKPPGRHRTAVALRSPAIDDDAVKHRASFATPAQPGTAVSVPGPVPTKAPAVRSAIVSHITGNARGHSESSLSNGTGVSDRHEQTQSMRSTEERYGVEDVKHSAWDSLAPQRASSSKDYPQQIWPTPSEQREWPTSRASAARQEDRGMDLTEAERRDLERALRASQVVSSPPPAASEYDLTAASAFLSTEELLNIQEALKSVTPPSEQLLDCDDLLHQKPAAVVAAPSLQGDEAEAIARALREADEEEERRSLELALRMQQEEAQQFTASVVGGLPGGVSSATTRVHPQGNVRSMTRAEYEAQQFPGRFSDDHFSPQSRIEDDLDEEDLMVEGYRMNSSSQQKWSRRDHSSIVGPNQEIRTKHDTTLHSEANAHRLGLLAEETPNLGNQAYNSFVHSMNTTKKGVAMKGTGRAGSDTDATKGGAMDPKVRQHISRAINSEIIEKCNGVVKEGKEAMVYHADKGAESGGFDVAIKVFKKIQEFRNRGYYVDGDPRYGNSSFRNLSSTEQLELWAEKEFRNLTRASRAGVPVPIPLYHKENIVFMRFLGEDGWPAPQLRELNLQQGSQRWHTLFSQVMEGIKQYVWLFGCRVFH
jgi:serine/threonine-protein kinase RIO1